MQYDIPERGCLLVSTEERTKFTKEIKAKQFNEENLEELRKKMIGKTQNIILYVNGVLNFKRENMCS